MDKLSVPLSIILLAITAHSAAFPSGELFAQTKTSKGRIGIGAQVGDPTGMTLKIYQRKDLAYHVLAAWNLDDFFSINAHLAFEHPITDSPLRYFLGPGLLLGWEKRAKDTELRAGISVLAGLNFFMEKFEVFLAATPNLRLVPNTVATVGGAVGLRYFF